MNLKRLSVPLVAAAVVLSFAWTRGSAQQNETQFDVTEIGDDVYTFRWNLHRNVFVITEVGVVVTDPINPEAAETMYAEIRRLTAKPVTHVIYSHEHWDHVLGGGIFRRDGARVVSHARCLPAFERRSHPDLALPDVTFSGPAHDLETGGRQFELRYFGPNHGDCMVVMRLPDVEILYAPDIVTPRTLGYRTMPDYSPVELIRSLKRIEDELDYTWVVGGHGDSVAPALAVTEQRIYYERLMAEVGRAWDVGVRDPAELSRHIELPQYRDWEGYEWLPLNVERAWAYYHMGW